MRGPSESRSIPDLFSDVVHQLGKLVHNEVQLARAEFAQKFRQAGQGAMLLGVAALIVVPALVMLLIGFALFLGDHGFSPVAAHLLSGLAAFVVSLALAIAGMNALKGEKLTPRVTLDQLERDVNAAKEIGT